MNDFGLVLIGEQLNYSIPKTAALMDARDWPALVALAAAQAEKGADYIDINVGTLGSEAMVRLVEEIQKRVSAPLCIDSPEIGVQRAALEHYQAPLAGAGKPIVNSLAASRPGFYDLVSVQPLKMILLCTEKSQEKGVSQNTTAEEIAATARQLAERFLQKHPHASPDDLYLDPGIHPVGCDMDSCLRRTLDALEFMQQDALLAKAHKVVGLSNFTVYLPGKTASGAPVKSALESAFLTLAVARGLDTIIGNVRRNYQPLQPEHPAMQTLEDILSLRGVDALQRLQSFYAL